MLTRQEERVVSVINCARALGLAGSHLPELSGETVPVVLGERWLHARGCEELENDSYRDGSPVEVLNNWRALVEHSAQVRARERCWVCEVEFPELPESWSVEASEALEDLATSRWRLDRWSTERRSSPWQLACAEEAGALSDPTSLDLIEQRRAWTRQLRAAEAEASRVRGCGVELVEPARAAAWEIVDELEAELGELWDSERLEAACEQLMVDSGTGEEAGGRLREVGSRLSHTLLVVESGSNARIESLGELALELAGVVGEAVELGGDRYRRSWAVETSASVAALVLECHAWCESVSGIEPMPRVRTRARHLVAWCGRVDPGRLRAAAALVEEAWQAGSGESGAEEIAALASLVAGGVAAALERV